MIRLVMSVTFTVGLGTGATRKTGQMRSRKSEATLLTSWLRARLSDFVSALSAWRLPAIWSRMATAVQAFARAQWRPCTGPDLEGSDLRVSTVSVSAA